MIFLHQDPWFIFMVLAWTLPGQHVTQLGHILQRCGGMAPKMGENFNLVSCSSIILFMIRDPKAALPSSTERRRLFETESSL